MPTNFAVLPETLLHTLNDGSDHQWRFVRLLHPRTALPTLFHTSNVSGGSILEVQAVSPVNQRSWMLDQEVIADGKMLVMTAVDPVFLLLPILKLITPATGLGNFRTAEDIFEECILRLKDVERVTEDISKAYSDLLMMPTIEGALGRLCESKDIGAGMRVYRYLPSKLTEYLKKKVDHLSASSLQELSRSVTRTFAKDGLLEDGKEDLLAVASTRMACELVSQYLPSDVASQLSASYDFKTLDAYVDELKREESQAMTMKNKKSESALTDKKRKPVKGSFGVEKLKKANVKGMSKLSDFFTKKA